MNTSLEDIAWDLIRAAWSSVAVYALAPLQDLLGLGNEARMNYPGSDRGNWTWRFRLNQLSGPLKERLRDYNQLYGRKTDAN